MKSVAAQWTTSFVRWRTAHAFSCALVIIASWCAPADAQVFPGDISPVRPIRIEGYWDRTKADPQVIGEIVLTADGRQRRTFGVTAIQGFKPEEEGMQILRHSSLQPALLLRGTNELIARLYGAKPTQPTQKVTIMGTYMAGSGTLTLMSADGADERE